MFAHRQSQQNGEEVTATVSVSHVLILLANIMFFNKLFADRVYNSILSAQNMLMWLPEFCIGIGGTWAADYPCYPL